MREMKDSGFAWIGEIPTTWSECSLRQVIIERNSGAWGDEPNENDDGIICLRIADFDYAKRRFRNTQKDELTKRIYTNSQISKLKLKYGDILIEKSGGGEKAPVGRAVLFDKDYDALYANFMDRIRIDNSITMPVYVTYWLSAWYACKSSPYYISQTTGIQNINLTMMLSKEHIFFPDLECQKNICIYLDTKCAEIDALAADIQTQIDTLEQYKRSVITEAVTKGLNPDVEMKESGIAWVKELPCNWSVIPAKHLFHNSDLRKQPNDELLTASQRYGVITQKEYMEREQAQIVTATQGIENWKHVEPNNFIISLRSFQGGLEMSETTGCITWHYVVLKASKKVFYRYYKWLFESSLYIKALQGTCNFIRDGQDLRFSNFSKVPLFEPPLDEQEQIADYLDKKCAEIDSIISTKQEQLATLAEYKKSLIFEYVTGKKEAPTA